MSWKLTKKLKETHLGPLANTFSRSPSTSTITDSSEKAQPNISGSATPTNEGTIAASEAMAQAPVVNPPKPGILVVTLHEGSLSTGGALSVAGSVRPSSSQRGAVGSFINGAARPQTSGGGFTGIPTNHGRISGKYMPYALLDFDKMQVFVNSVEGTPENPSGLEETPNTSSTCLA
ncbi:hypothetical protein Ct61P_11388 [Colletotrichum tofieldiae]|nr:hypothetical protein Ct61P_11388 [Colletotrichum tofieldiae]